MGRTFSGVYKRRELCLRGTLRRSMNEALGMLSSTCRNTQWTEQMLPCYVSCTHGRCIRINALDSEGFLQEDLP